MAILPLRYAGDPILRRKAKPVKQITKRLRKLAMDMLNTMYQANGVGLAAPQVGVSERLIVVDVGEGAMVLVNPELVAASAEQEMEVEGCLSIPGVQGRVVRPAGVTVKALDLEGKTQKVVAKGLLARALQHEMDHLEGILFVDRATDLTGGRQDPSAKKEEA